MFLLKKLVIYFNLQVEAIFNYTLSESVHALQSTTGEYKEYQEEFQKLEKKVNSKKMKGLLSVSSLASVSASFYDYSAVDLSFVP